MVDEVRLVCGTPAVATTNRISRSTVRDGSLTRLRLEP